MSRRSMARRLLAAFTAGLLAGAAAMASLVARRAEQWDLERARLQDQLADQHNRLTRLEEALDQHRRTVVREVRVEVRGVSDEAARLEVERRLRALAEDLVGRRLEQLEPTLVVRIFDGRLVDLEDRRYMVAVRLLVLGERTWLVVDVVEAGTPLPRPVPRGREEGLARTYGS